MKRGVDSLKKAFEQAANENYWSDADSVSGPGSNLIQTGIIRKKIPDLLEKYNIKKMLDAPCGDLFWMKEILPQILAQGIEYNGADIVPKLVERHQLTFENPKIKFYILDLTIDAIPLVDLVFTRDCFIHLSYRNIAKILRNYKQSGATYLLTNTYTKTSRNNSDVDEVFLWGRMLNLQKFPFFFPEPLEFIVEGCTEGSGEFSDKSLGLWKISDLNLFKFNINIELSVFYTMSIKMLRKVKASLKQLKSLKQ